MRRIRNILLIMLLGAITYYLVFYTFSFLKVQGYTYMFRVNTPYDLVIKHAMILDGTGINDMFKGDIAIRDGYIAGVGYVNAKDSPVFDAGGLTAVPMPVGINKTGKISEHLFATAFPRYPAQYIFFREGPYKGLNLAQIAKRRGENSARTFAYLTGRLNQKEKVYLVPLELDEGKLGEGRYSLSELMAYLTGSQALAQGMKDRGMIKAGYRADILFFVNRDYNEDQLKSLFLKGELPAIVSYCRKGIFSNQ